MSDLSYYARKIPSHLIIEKCLWVGNVSVEIDHIDNSLKNQLDYEAAFKKMLDKLKIKYNHRIHSDRQGRLADEN